MSLATSQHHLPFEEEPFCAFIVVLAFSVAVSCPCCITATDVAASTFSPWAKSLVATQGRLRRMQVGRVTVIHEAILLLVGGLP